MNKIQNFSYHTHNNALGVFDGRSSALEMLQQAENLGWSEIGVTNHLIWHPHMPQCSKMFFQDFDKLVDTMQRSLEVLKEAASRVNIKVLSGFEVDFFPSALWRRQFEKLLKVLDVDYYIGSTHTVRTADESRIYNIFHLEELPSGTTAEDMDELIKNYWLNVIESAQSGYFAFIAHLDYCAIFNLGVEPKWDDYKWRLIEALAKAKQPFELNTSGFERIKSPHPAPWMLKELKERNVPVVISDDAHSTTMLGRYFNEAEDLLSSLNYTNRWKFNK